MALATLKHSQQMRFTGERWGGLKRAANRFRVTGRQNAQRQINQLFMAYFGLIDDPVSSATMGMMIADRMQQKGRLADET